MYRAKQNGRARYELFDTDMHANAVAMLRLESDLRRSLDRDELQVFYQPIVSLEEAKISGFEALVRWQHPKRGLGKSSGAGKWARPRQTPLSCLVLSGAVSYLNTPRDRLKRGLLGSRFRGQVGKWH